MIIYVDDFANAPKDMGRHHSNCVTYAKRSRFVVLLVVNLSIKVSQTDEFLFAVVLAKALNSRARFAYGNVCT